MTASDLVARFPEAAYIDPTARIFGRVSLGQNASVWPGAVIRAECQEVRVGAGTNIQDHVMIHVGFAHPTVIGAHCSITHRVVLHGCRIEDNCLIGIGATIMDGAVIGANSIVAGHAFVREGTIIPPDTIVMGTPGKVVRTADNRLANRMNAFAYACNARAFAAGDHRVWASAAFEAEARAERARLMVEFGLA